VTRAARQACPTHLTYLAHLTYPTRLACPTHLTHLTYL